MPEIKLTEDEQADLGTHLNASRRLSEQIEKLKQLRGREIKDASWIWKAISLEKGNGKNPPETLVDPDGNLSVTFRDGVATWGEDEKTNEKNDKKG